jgi:hypothetical protein
MGMGYGLLVRHLHDDRRLAPFQVEGIIKPRDDAGYLLFWGIAGVALGSLLPWVDTLFAVPELDTSVFEKKKEEEEESEGGIWGADWTPVVRSVGAFVGIAYAIVCPPLRSFLSLVMVVLMCCAEKTPLDFNPTSLFDTRACEPSPLVPNRPLQTRIHPLHRRWRHRHGSPARLEPRYDALSSLLRELNFEISLFGERRELGRGMGGEREYRGRCLDIERVVL